MDDEIMRAIEEAAAKAGQSQDRLEREAFIGEVVSEVADYVRIRLVGSARTPNLKGWADRRQYHFSLQIGEVVRILLCKELLEEE